MASALNTSEKVTTCLDYIDHRLEQSSEQTIQIAEMIINDIRSLTNGYTQALNNNQLADYTQEVRHTQMKWVNQLHDIILEQTNRDLNGQVIQALQKFAKGLNEKQLKHADFDLPSAVASIQPDQHEYLNQEEIELLMAANIEDYSHTSESRH